MINTTSPPKLNRGLIDASERPLRRSPPGKPYEQEEWPVLFPDRPTTPGTLQAMAGQQDGTIASSTQPPQLKERYPLLPSSSYGPSPNVERKQQKTSSSPKIQRKQVSSPNLRKDLTSTNLSHAEKENLNPSNNAPRRITGPASKPGSGSPSKLKALAVSPAAVDKSAYESKPTIEPRQTRTSSLRARISAGHVIKDSPSGSNKVLGFTDFTSTKDLSTVEHEDLHSSTRAPPGAYPVSRKSSRDSLRGRRPAQFVAGSRRPPSRGSLRSESRASSYSVHVPPPSRTAPTIPLALDRDLLPVKSSAGHKEAETVPRKSSIPVFRHTISSAVTQTDDKLTPPEDKETETHTSKAKVAPQDFGIFEDNNEGHQALALGAIEESPQSAYHLKRLSVTSPEHGPTLKISPSADRLIMGTGSDKENEPVLKKKKSKDACRVLATNDLRSSSKTKAPLRSSGKPVAHPRPSSSQGLPESASRPKLVDTATREKKVKSVDIGASLSIDHLMRLSGIETPKPNRKNTDASTSDDPFFDAQSSLNKRMSRATGTEKESHVQHDQIAADSESWVEPVQKHLGLTANSDALLVPADVQSVLTHEGTVQEFEAPSNEASVPTASQSTADLPKDLPSRAKHTPLKVTEPTPSTPEHGITSAGSSNSGSLPPRSSSRTAHPNFTGNKLSPVSPLGNKEQVPQDFTDRQNRLGSVRGHGTSQVDFAVPVSNRTSVAQESNKSHGSVSKGVLSKFGGLFHKRNSDDPTASSKSGKKSKQQKVSITSNGSPFPPISEIHPVHRPTLSSMRRANGNATRSPLPEISHNGASTPAFNSPLPTEVSTTTTLAMQILESARKERSSPKKERLLELGKIMVDSITQARDAEKAMEEAKQAARKAEVAHALCKKSVGDISKLVVEWRDEMARGASN